MASDVHAGFLTRLLPWTFGVIFLFAALLLIGLHPSNAVALLLCGLFLLPPFRRLIVKHTKYVIPKWLSIVVGIIGMSALISLAEPPTPQPTSHNVPTSSQFELTSENQLGGGFTAYNYVSRDGKYGIKFFVPAVTTDFDAGYVLESTQETINGILVTYAFHEKTTVVDTVTAEAYEALQFIFEKDEKRYAGFVRRSDATGDKEGLRSTMRSFMKHLPI